MATESSLHDGVARSTNTNDTTTAAATVTTNVTPSVTYQGKKFKS